MAKSDKIRESSVGTVLTIDFAGYFYFLRSDEIAAKEIRRLLQLRYELIEEKTAEQFIFESGQPHEIIFADSDRTQRVELQLAFSGNAIIAIIIWSSAEAPTVDRWRSRLDELSSLEGELNRAGATLVSVSAAIVGDTNAALTAAPLLPTQLSFEDETAWGVFIHFPQTAMDRKHLYVFTVAEGADPCDFLTKGMVEIDWPLHQLLREITYYEDQRLTVQREKHNIDKEVNEIFHREGGVLKPLSDKIAVMEDEVGRLSKMYSLLATDLHLVNKSSAHLREEIDALRGIMENYLLKNDDRVNDFSETYLQRLGKSLTALENDETGLRLSLDSAKAAIDVVRTQVELFRGGEGMALQEQTKEILKQNAAIQVAAQVIELVLIFYYTIHSWDTVALPYNVEKLSPAVKFSVVGLFSVSMVFLTHQVAKAVERKSVKSVMLLISIILVMIALAAMALVPGLLLSPGH